MGDNKIYNKISELSIMNSFTLKEKYDISNAQKILHCGILDDEYKGSLRKYLKYGKGGAVEVNYTQNEIGRLNIRVKALKEGESSINQSLMWRECKSALCKKNYVDLDMVNCHPVLLEQVFKDKGYECSVLTAYNKSREKFFKKMETHGIDRDNCKILIMRIFYGGSINAWCKDNKLDKSKIEGSIVYDLESELKVNTKELLNTEELLKYRLEAEKNKGKEYYNNDGTAMAYFLQTLECRCLMVMYNYLKTNGYMVGSLIHDGLHLQKKPTKDEDEDFDYNPLITEIKKKLYKETGFMIDLKIKDFKHIEELDNIIVIESDKQGGDYITDQLKNDYVISQERIFMRVNNVWTTNEKVIKRGLIKAIGNMNIFFGKGEDIVPYSTMAKSCNQMIQYVEPTEDEDFVDKLWSSNLYKLCFKNGYYDFKKGKLEPYDIDTHTTIKINRDFKKATPETIEQVYQKILDPIFNHNKELRDTWLNYIVRGVAGHIEDKNWGVGIGERDCGKGVLVGLLESCFTDYCRATNSENFLFKAGQADSAKALSWLVPFEFKRLLLTNEITRDSQGKYRINGNVLKKLSSGGDKIEARVNHKDEINFKIQARVCMFCNDLPPIEPADTKETAYMFKYPSKFLNKGDDRLGKPLMRPKMKEVGEDMEYVMEKKEAMFIRHKDYPDSPHRRYWKPATECNPEEIQHSHEYKADHEFKIMENVCNFFEKDDDIKYWCKKPEVLDAFIEILFTHYGSRVEVPESMKEEMDDFKEEEKEEDKFLSMFRFVGDKNWNEDEPDFVSIAQISVLLKKSHINLSSQKYKNYLTPKGAFKGKRLNENTKKREPCWNNIQIDKEKVEEMKCAIDDD